MAYNIQYNGFNLNEIMKIQNVTRPLLAERETKVLEIPNKDGGQLQHVRHKPKKIPVDIAIIGRNHEEIRNNARVAGSILNVRKPVPIVFSDEPHLTFYGLLADASELNQIHVVGKGTINLLFPDPHGYEESNPQILTVTGQQTAIVDHDSNTEIFPVIKVKFKQPATFFSVADPDNNVVLVGRPPEVGRTPIQPLQLVLSDAMDNVSLWTHGNFPQVDGVAQGTFKTNGYSFSVDQWGTSPGPNIWYGPAAKRSLPEPINDFLIDLHVEMYTTIDKVGRIELYLLDINNNVIGKIKFVDAYTNYTEPSAWIWGGNPQNNNVEMLHEWKMAWANFIGLLRIEREGKRWKAWVSEKVNGVWEQGERGKTPVYWADDNTGAVAQIMIHIGGIQTAQDPTMAITDIKVYKYNETGEAPEEIFQAGDELELDFNTGVVRKNGELFMEHLDAGSKFFGIPSGQTQLAFFPSSTNTIESLTVNYKQRWL